MKVWITVLHRLQREKVQAQKHSQIVTEQPQDGKYKNVSAVSSSLFQLSRLHCVSFSKPKPFHLNSSFMKICRKTKEDYEQD